MLRVTEGTTAADIDEALALMSADWKRAAETGQDERAEVLRSYMDGLLEKRLVVG